MKEINKNITENIKGELFPELEKLKGKGYLQELLCHVENIENIISEGEKIKYKLSDLYNTETEKVIAERDKMKDYFGDFNSKSVEKRKENNDYEGIYIFLEENKPIYTGISRKIINRLRNHGWGESTGTSTLAYLMAREENNGDKLTVEKYNDDFNEVRTKFTKIVQNLNVLIYPFKRLPDKDAKPEYFSLQLLEVLVSINLRTRFNSFKTH